MKESQATSKQGFVNSNSMIEGILIIYFVLGILISPFYGTWVVGIGVGSLILGLYFTSKLFFSKVQVYAYIASVGLALFMAQFIYQMHGLFEMHFTAFIGAIALIIFRNWKIFIPFTLVVAVHHAAFAYIQYYGFTNNLPKYKSIYFTQLDYMTFETFLFHVVLFVFAVVLAGWYAGYLGQLNSKSESDIKSLETFKESMIKNIEFANTIAQGDYKYEFQVSESDELGTALQNMRKNLLEGSDREKQDRYLNLGLAEVAEIIRKHGANLTEMSDKLISYLVKYLNANQGALFVTNEDNNEKFLELKSCYAYDRKKYIDKRIELGEGMVGQCFLEKEITYLKEIPEEYVKITSGLGEATPTTLLLVPMISNEIVEGVLEIATFDEFETYQIKFLEKVGESIASSLNTAKVNERIKQLYEESQQQAEEMRAQEEEMRQNMEELAATQEEMARNSNQMQDRIRSLDTSKLSVVEFDVDGKVLSANNAFLSLMGYDESEVTGGYHRMFADQAMITKDEYKQFWKDLQLGKPKEGIYTRYRKNNEKVLLAATYTPVLDEEGHVTRIIKYGVNITAGTNGAPKVQNGAVNGTLAQ